MRQINLLVALMLMCSLTFGQIIINHSNTDITDLSGTNIKSIKTNLHIMYAHTSHGSQLTEGMDGLVTFANGGGKGLSLPNNIFSYNNGGIDSALDLDDHYADMGDVGYYPDWYNYTTYYLDNPANSDINVVMWSWCGQVDDKYAAGTLYSDYLEPMGQLEQAYPNIRFVYMTGHLDHWDDANNKAANDSIRRYCQRENKILYDFADVESYNPDGTYFEYAGDDCNHYNSDGDYLGNWATEWRASHTEGTDWYNCGAQHSDALNANQKAYAAWHLFDEINKDILFEKDSLALVAIYNSTNGAGWTKKTNWLTGNLSTWYGVTVTGGRVTGLNLISNNLIGSLPVSIQYLDALTILDLANNSKLIGSIPAGIGNMKELTLLYLSGSGFTGSFPTGILQLSNLIEINLNWQKFASGVMPDFSNLKKLEKLSVENCNFNGKIPSSLLSMTNLKSLAIGSNSFTASVMPDFSSLINLTHLYIRGCNFTGAVPSSLLQMHQLLVLDMGFNSFSAAAIPDFSKLVNLQHLDTYKCNFTGAIPSSLSSLTKLQFLSISNNSLTGSIPKEIGNLAALNSFYLNNNQLSGSIPAELGNISGLTYLYLNNNNFSGDIPNSIGNLKKLYIFDLHNNFFTFANLKSSSIVPGKIGIFTYVPQKTIFEIGENGSTLTSLDCQEATNKVTWYRNGSLLPDTLRTINIGEDGNYYFKVTNSTYPLLTIYSDTVWAEASAIATNLLVSDSSVISGEIPCFNAYDTITVAGDGDSVVFENGSSVTLIAGKSIQFLPGFKAESGSFMSASITINGSYCNASGGDVVSLPKEKNAGIETSSADKLTKKMLKVYPNPNNGCFRVELTNFESNTEICVYNSLGEKVYQSNTCGHSTWDINLPNSHKGIYFVRVTNGEEQFTRKMVVN